MAKVPSNLCTIHAKQVKIIPKWIKPGESTSGSDNNAMLQCNKERLAAENDEENDVYKEDKKENKARDPCWSIWNRNDNHGEELNTN